MADREINDLIKLIPEEKIVSCEVYEWLLKMMEEAKPNAELIKLFKEYKSKEGTDG